VITPRTLPLLPPMFAPLASGAAPDVGQRATTPAASGRIETGVPTANVARGEDGSTLLISADTTILRLRTTKRAVREEP
jgi:hypothetical protein